jgi:hypothetical protein
MTSGVQTAPVFHNGFIGDICGSILLPIRSAIVLTTFVSAADHLSPVGAAINRVIAIAPAPLLPARNKLTTLTWHRGSSKPHSRGMRFRNFLSVTSSISLGKFFGFGVPRPGS